MTWSPGSTLPNRPKFPQKTFDSYRWRVDDGASSPPGPRGASTHSNRVQNMGASTVQVAVRDDHRPRSSHTQRLRPDSREVSRAVPVCFLDGAASW